MKTKLNKLLIVVPLLAVITLALALRFDSTPLAVAALGFALSGVWLSVQRSAISRTLGQWVDSQMTERVQQKLDTYTPDEKERLAAQFVREAGSDTRRISLESLKRAPEDRSGLE